MDYIDVRDLQETSGERVEDRPRALRLQSFGRAWEALAGQARASGAADMTEDEIQAEIDAVREERTSAAGAAGQP